MHCVNGGGGNFSLLPLLILGGEERSSEESCLALQQRLDDIYVFNVNSFMLIISGAKENVLGGIAVQCHLHLVRREDYRHILGSISITCIALILPASYCSSYCLRMCLY